MSLHLTPSTLRSMLRSGLFRQLFGWFFVVNLCVLLTSVMLTRQLSNRSNTLAAVSAEASREALAALAAQGPRGLDQLHDRWRRGRLINLYVETEGHFIGNSRVPQQVFDHLPQFDGDILQRELFGGEQLRVMPLTFTVGNNAAQQGHLVMFRTLEARSNWSLTTLLSIQIGISLLAIIVVGAFVAHRFSQPLRVTQSTVAHIGDGELSARVPDTATARDDEFGQLARGVNDMAQRIEELINDRNRLLHDVSHEMRSPLARLRILLELARNDQGTQQQGQLNKADTEITRMDALVEEVLSYARATHLAQQPSTEMELIDIQQLLHSTLESAHIEAEAAQVTLTLAAPDERCLITGYPALLSRACDNLLRNAIRYSPAGGSVQLSVHRHSDEVTISVQDQGPGVPEAELERIFHPFVRIPGEERGKGYGLGLALVQRIATLHHAKVSARNVQPHGLQVSLQFTLS